MLVSEANRILSENNLHALPVVDGGRLRGLVTRANLLRMGHFVLRTQNADEFNFFVTRLEGERHHGAQPCHGAGRATPWSIACCEGQAAGRGAVSGARRRARGGRDLGQRDLRSSPPHCLGAWERRSGVTLAPVELGPGVLGRIADVAEAAGAVPQALYPIGPHHEDPGHGAAEKKVDIRFHAPEVGDIVSALEAAGFPSSTTEAPRADPGGSKDERTDTRARRPPQGPIDPPAAGGGDDWRDRRDLRRGVAADPEALGQPTHLIVSEVAGTHFAIETDMALDEVRSLADVVHSNKDLAAAVSSGSFRTRGMVVVPCSVKTLSGIANASRRTC